MIHAIILFHTIILCCLLLNPLSDIANLLVIFFAMRLSAQAYEYAFCCFLDCSTNCTVFHQLRKLLQKYTKRLIHAKILCCLLLVSLSSHSTRYVVVHQLVRKLLQKYRAYKTFDPRYISLLSLTCLTFFT